MNSIGHIFTVIKTVSNVTSMNACFEASFRIKAAVIYRIQIYFFKKLNKNKTITHIEECYIYIGEYNIEYI